jgi:sulfur carrier protein
MTVVVNGHEQDLPDTTTLASLVRGLGRDPAQPGTAVARNGDVVPRRQWADTTLDDGDQVEVVTAVGGG